MASKCRLTQPAHQRGMTLLELLVTLSLLALVSTLLMQGFATALVTYERVQRKQNESLPLELGYRWFSETLAGTQAELDAPRQFGGDARQLRGITHRPLLGQPGQTSPFAWTLQEAPDGSLQLLYSQGERLQWPIAQWPAGSQGRFIYRNLQGAPAERWPEGTSAPGTTADGSIPGAILLEITPSNAPPLRWYANLPGRTYPRADYREF